MNSGPYSLAYARLSKKKPQVYYEISLRTFEGQQFTRKVILRSLATENGSAIQIRLFLQAQLARRLVLRSFERRRKL
jgi:hypothetical protein